MLAAAVVSMCDNADAEEPVGDHFESATVIRPNVDGGRVTNSRIRNMVTQNEVEAQSSSFQSTETRRAASAHLSSGAIPASALAYSLWCLRLAWRAMGTSNASSSSCF